MVFLKVLGAGLCRVVDERADAAARAEFVRAEWEVYRETMPPSVLRRTCYVLAKETGTSLHRRSGDTQNLPADDGARRIASALATMQHAEDLWVVKEVVRRLRKHEEERERVIRFDCRTYLQNAAMFVHDDEVLLPLSLLRTVRGLRLQELLCGDDVGSAPRGVLVVNPARSQPNAHRREKNRRMERIGEYVAQRCYESLVDSSVRRPPGAGAAGHPGGLLGHSFQRRHAAADYLSFEDGRRRGAGGLDGSGDPPETLAVFMRDAGIGVDMFVMILSGGLVGYYINYFRGQSATACLTSAAIGMIAMLIVDAVLLLTRIQKEDEASVKAKRRRRRQLLLGAPLPPAPPPSHAPPTLAEHPPPPPSTRPKAD